MQNEKREIVKLGLMTLLAYFFYFFLREVENLIFNRVVESIAEIKALDPSSSDKFDKVSQVLSLVHSNIYILYTMLILLFFVVLWKSKANKYLRSVLALCAVALGCWVKFSIH